MKKSNETKSGAGCLLRIFALIVFLYVFSAIVDVIDYYKTPQSVRDLFDKNRRTTSASYSTGSGAGTVNSGTGTGSRAGTGSGAGSGAGVYSAPAQRSAVSWRDDYEVPDDDPEITFDDYDDDEGDEDYD